ncbi:hypothetical protein SLEP1_g44484 [Rubroshorea leprosula]|uniref:SAM domain-containing protein n=1 Tax=Rubroshorea leprosula TaxID=152421 RepID=A0AAV5LGE3_9ROSI|nr:hypothetical protein SLEP1_g44484 [Rubroshorea leprosula]
MAEIHPSEGQVNGAGGPLVVGSLETVGSKRQRRPSVRLGDIGGDQSYDTHVRRVSGASAKQWKHQADHSLNPSAGAKSSKTRVLTNLSSDYNNETLGEDKEGNIKSNSNLDCVAIGSWRVKDTKKWGSSVTKRVRSNWVSKVDDSGGGGGRNGSNNSNNMEVEDKYSSGEDVDDFDKDNSESPLKEQSPIHSLAHLAMDGNEREVLYHGNNSQRSTRARVLENRDHHDGMELSGPSDTDMRRCGEDGVRIWLNGLGLGRYAPVFEIHEVDDEVLPLLTLEDLKDMGINAVGSRRKMFCAIQKLSSGFS